MSAQSDGRTAQFGFSRSTRRPVAWSRRRSCRGCSGRAGPRKRRARLWAGRARGLRAAPRGGEYAREPLSKMVGPTLLLSGPLSTGVGRPPILYRFPSIFLGRPLYCVPMTSRRRCATLLVALVAALALATAAGAEIVTRADSEGPNDHLRRPGAERRRRLVRRDPPSRRPRRRDLPRIDPHRLRRGRSRALRRRRGRVLLARRKRREDGRPRRQGHEGRSDVPARIRASPRPLVECQRCARAERDAGVVGASRHGGAGCTGRRRLRLLAWLEPQHRRDLRGGLRLDPHPVSACDPLAFAARRGASHCTVRGARRRSRRRSCPRSPRRARS